MPRWKNGAPKKLYILVINEFGRIHAFETKRQRTLFVNDRTPIYPDGTYVFSTFVQEEA